MKKCLVISLVTICLLLAGCMPSIPNKVSPEEYEIYTAWVKYRFEKKPPAKLFFGTTTFNEDPLSPGGCGNVLHDKGKVSWSLIKQLHALGEARYPVDFYTKRNMIIPWEYKETDEIPITGPRDFHSYSFTRVAFDKSHTEALFGVSNNCGGECGGGAMVAAVKDNGSWVFRDAGCFWIY